MGKEKLIHYLTTPPFSLEEKQAHALIMTRQVLVDDVPIDKPGTLIKNTAHIRLKNSKKSSYVSRGGDKLASAMLSFGLKDHVQDRVCLDIGLSTGGFSDYLLKNKAKNVVGVDVSYGILDLKLREDPRMVFLERTNARTVTKKDLVRKVIKKGLDQSVVDEISLVVMDVSFISVLKILPTVATLLTKETDLVILIKPQFEAPPALVPKGGVISDMEVVKGIVDGVKEKIIAAGNFVWVEECLSGVKGTKGNQEYFFHLKFQSK